MFVSVKDVVKAPPLILEAMQVKVGAAAEIVARSMK